MSRTGGDLQRCRKSARTYGKSDSIDALAVARAALADPDLPSAHDDAAASELKLLSDHRANLIHERSTAQDRLRWHLHDLWPELEIAPGGLDRESGWSGSATASAAANLKHACGSCASSSGRSAT